MLVADLGVSYVDGTTVGLSSKVIGYLIILVKGPRAEIFYKFILFRSVIYRVFYILLP